MDAEQVAYFRQTLLPMIRDLSRETSGEARDENSLLGVVRGLLGYIDYLEGTLLHDPNAPG